MLHNSVAFPVAFPFFFFLRPKRLVKRGNMLTESQNCYCSRERKERERERHPALKYLFDPSVQPEMKCRAFHLQNSREIQKESLFWKGIENTTDDKALFLSFYSKYTHTHTHARSLNLHFLHCCP